MSIDFADAIIWLWFIFLGGSICIGLLKAAYDPARRFVRRTVPIRSWREEKKRDDAEKTRVEGLFLKFVRETRPLAPKAKKHQEAAVYRHVWKRAAVLEIMAQRQQDVERAALYREFQELASGQYYPIAPSNAYGTVQLQLESRAGGRLLELEERRLLPPPPRGQKRRKPGASKPCIYVGRTSDGMVYVGQTQEAPELRGYQHRREGTGPFKSGDPEVDWSVLEPNLPLSMLDEMESYYIGLLDAFESGYNENRGNDSEAYDRGCAERVATATQI